MTTPEQLDFRTPIISDRTWMVPILRKYGNSGSESAFGTLFIWCERLLHKFSYTSDTLFIAFGIENPSYQFPLGPMPLAESLRLMMEDARSRGNRFRLWGLDAEQMAAVESAMPGVFAFTPDRDGSDYIYTTEQMITLAGRKLHRKRNHLRRFQRQYRSEYEPISSDNLLECQQFVIDWLFANEESEDDAMRRETCALLKALRFFDELSFVGGLLRVDGRLVAFTFGEAVNDEVFVIHFEKALTEYEGAYTAINQQFAERELSGYRYINREEDMGIEGLRKAKLSYYPEYLLEKHVATRKDEVR
jgi:uncharacterized protein